MSPAVSKGTPSDSIVDEGDDFIQSHLNRYFPPGKDQAGSEVDVKDAVGVLVDWKVNCKIQKKNSVATNFLDEIYFLS